MSKKALLTRTATLALALFAAASLTVLRAGQTPAGSVAIDGDDIGGVVTGAKGPEAGVWVIAETRDTPTRLIKSVVTDDQGRYLVPDLPKGNYDVWVRGYGLVDSPKTKATPGTRVNLKAVAAPNAKAAAAYYPAQYWFALLQVPPPTDFPGTGPQGNGIAPNIKSQGEWIRQVDQHRRLQRLSSARQQGDARASCRPTRPRRRPRRRGIRRIQAGQAGGGMSNRFSQVGRARALAMYANWTDRIAAGELPTAAPARPQGRERNVVITMWDWADPKVYAHDEIATDKRNPTVNANGPVYGALEESADYMPTIDPTRHTAGQVKLTVRDPKTPSAANTPPPQPSPYWGEEAIWTSQTSTHSFAMDRQARVWAASRIRQNATHAVVPGWIGPSVGQVVPADAERPAARAVRSENEADDAHRYVLQFRSRESRQERRPVVLLRPRRRRGLVRHEDLGQDARRAEGAGLDGVHPRHQRQRKEGCVHRARPADGSDEGPPDERHVLRRVAGVGRLGLGNDSGRARRHHAPGSRDRIRPRRRSPNTTKCRSRMRRPPAPVLRRAAWTSTARTSSGRCCRAVSWRASTAASARAS